MTGNNFAHDVNEYCIAYIEKVALGQEGINS